MRDVGLPREWGSSPPLCTCADQWARRILYILFREGVNYLIIFSCYKTIFLARMLYHVFVTEQML